MLALFAVLSWVAIIATVVLIGLIATLSRGAAEVTAADARMQASAQTKVARLRSGPPSAETSAKVKWPAGHDSNLRRPILRSR
jgi:hypothetical protein